MPPAAGAHARHLPGLRHDVVDDRVPPCCVAADTRRHPVELQCVARAVGDIVVRARGVAADADAADDAAADL